jgi:hypothetical protein
MWTSDCFLPSALPLVPLGTKEIVAKKELDFNPKQSRAFQLSDNQKKAKGTEEPWSAMGSCFAKTFPLHGCGRSITILIVLVQGSCLYEGSHQI